MATLKLESKGLYMAENLETHEQYFVHISGEAPMLQVVNVLSVDVFCKGSNYETAEKQQVIRNIIDHVNNFSWVPIKFKLQLPERKKDIQSDLSSFKSLEENRDKYEQMILNNEDNLVIVEICSKENVSVEKGTEILKQFKATLNCGSVRHR